MRWKTGNEGDGEACHRFKAARAEVCRHHCPEGCDVSELIGSNSVDQAVKAGHDAGTVGSMCLAEIAKHGLHERVASSLPRRNGRGHQLIERFTALLPGQYWLRLECLWNFTLMSVQVYSTVVGSADTVMVFSPGRLADSR